MSKYNLSDNVNESVPVQVAGLNFIFRYPLTEELEDIQLMYDEIETLQGQNKFDEVKEVNKKLENVLYDFIEPVGHDQSFREVMKKQNVKVLRNFNKMITTELAMN